jgi:hypothetical protein
VCFVVCKTTSELEHAILTTLSLTGAENIDSWHVRLGDLQHAFPLDILMVPTSAVTFTTNDERLTCGDFSLGKTVHLWNLEFIVDYFSSLSLSPRRGNSGAASWAQLAVGHHPYGGP